MPARRRPSSPFRLSSERIVDAAIEIMREDGYDALTMRRLAAQLGTGQASLYAHVANKTDLDRLVITHLLVSQPPPDEALDWREMIVSEAMSLFTLTVAHPGIARAYPGSAPTHPTFLAREETVLRVLRDAGLTEREAAALSIGSSLLALARAQEEDVLRQRIAESGLTEAAWYAAVRESVTAEADDLPLLRAMVEQIHPENRLGVFAEMVQLMVDGAQSRLTQRAAAPAQT